MHLEKPDFEDVLQKFAEGLKVKVVNKKCTIDSAFGKGYCWCENLPSGIAIMVSDTSLNNPYSIDRAVLNEHHYILQFNEEAADEESVKEKGKRRNEEFQSVVKLSTAVAADTYMYPSAKRLRSVKILFNQQHLYSLLKKEEADEIIGEKFPFAIQSQIFDPIATEYRVMLDELWVNKIDQPLRLNFIQNRVLLLIEKYIVKLYEKRTQDKKIKRSEDEAMRLMKVEALLVKSFEIPPPTIDELSRISAMSPTKLKNDFKAFYGMPVYEYYQKNRMLKAKSLLVQSKYTIREVGRMVGYANLSHFANTFKKEFGFLPSELAAKDGVLVYSK